LIADLSVRRTAYARTHPWIDLNALIGILNATNCGPKLGYAMCHLMRFVTLRDFCRRADTITSYNIQLGLYVNIISAVARHHVTELRMRLAVYIE